MSAIVAPAPLPETLNELARRPRSLFCLLFTLNAIGLPYLGFVHDARLYSGQTLRAIDPGLLESDLFFRFGSQDRFSLFSRILAPLVQALGLDLAFFLFHLLGVAIFLLGLQRLVVRLFPNSPGAVVGLLYAALIGLPYGGHFVFHVVEPFTTPRLAASGLTFWSLATAIEGRWRWTLPLAVSALALHPLMAFPGLVIVTALGLWNLGARWLGAAAVCGTIFLAGLLALPTVGVRVFGHMDEDWKEMVRLCSAYHFPDSWPVANWTWALAGIGFLLGASRLPDNSGSGQGRLLLLSGTLGLLGLVGSCLVTRGPYALLMQGQPYRALWITSALLPSAALAIAWQGWQSGGWLGRLGALAIAIYLGLTADCLEPMVWLLFTVPAAWLVLRSVAPAATAEATCLGALAGGLALDFLLWGTYRLWRFVTVEVPTLPILEPLLVYQLILTALGPGFLVTLAVLAICILRRVLLSSVGSMVAAGTALAWQVAFFAVPSSTFNDPLDPVAPAVRFVAAHLERHRGETPATVYSDLGQLNRVWLDWRSRSYYDPVQTAGVVFSRATAMEVRRRSHLVAPFEMARWRARWRHVPPVLRDDVQKLHRITVHDASLDPGPSRDDVLRLARDGALDFIVLWFAGQHDIQDLVEAAENGVRIIDARRLRARYPDPKVGP